MVKIKIKNNVIELEWSMRLLCQIAILTVMGSCFPGTADSAESEFSVFHELRKHIERNCVECTDHTESEFRRLVSELEALVNSGFTPLEARKLLAESYNDLGIVYERRESPEQVEFLRKCREIYRELSEEFPENTDILWYFASASLDVSLFESVTNRSAGVYAEANYISGGLLRAQADEESQALGLERIREAFRTASGIEKVNYGQKLVSELRVDELESEAAEIENEVSAYRREHGL